VGRSTGSSAVTYAFLVLASMAAALPIVGVLFIALDKPNAIVGGVTIPHQLSFANLERVWTQGNFGTGLLWSTLITLATVAIATVLAVPAGYAFATIQFPGRSLFFYLFVFGLILPYASVLIPAYYELRRVSLAGTAWAVILPSAALSVAFGTFWMRAAFLGVPKDLLEAARVDGANSPYVFIRIALPLVRSAVLALVLLTFMSSWNAFLVPIVMLAGSDIQTATMGLASFQSGHVDDITGLAASAVFVSAPVILVFLLTQRQFIRGMTEGGLKM
jgi:raffinose/stachyose/melibiose transport system permease protein